MNKFISAFSIPIWLIGMVTNLFFPALLLKLTAIKHKANLIHAIELNHAGYLVFKAHRLGLPSNIKIISTNWGSDIYWFQRFPKHAKNIRSLMEISDFYTAECTRDLKLAIDFGFTGQFGEVLPNSGGFAFSELTQKRILTSSRKSIVIKGYESFVGRASIALDAVAEVSPLLADYKIYVYSANWKTIRKVKKIKKQTKLDFITFPKKSLSHGQVLDLFNKSRIYVGISLSDAISTSLLEAMVCGAYPIQTNTSCADEWITTGITGEIVEPIKSAVITSLKIALSEDLLVDKAATINHDVAMKRLGLEKIKEKLINFYDLQEN